MFEGQRIFLDLRDHEVIQKLERCIQLHGGSVEKFLSNEISCIISDREKTEYNAGGCNQTLPDTVQMTGKAKESPMAMVPLHGNSISVGALSRGQKLLMRSKSFKESIPVSAAGDPVKFASLWKIPIISADAAIRMSNSLPKTKLEPTIFNKENRGVRCRSIKTLTFGNSFIKVEDFEARYRPFYSKTSCLLNINIPLVTGVSVFDKLGKSLIGSNATRKQTSVKNVQKADVATIKRQKESGYCECCDLFYSNVIEHQQSAGHKLFANSQHNYGKLDSLIAELPTLESFLCQVNVEEKTSMNAGITSEQEQLPADIGLEQLSSDCRSNAEMNCLMPFACDSITDETAKVSDSPCCNDVNDDSGIVSHMHGSPNGSVVQPFVVQHSVVLMDINCNRVEVDKNGTVSDITMLTEPVEKPMIDYLGLDPPKWDVVVVSNSTCSIDMDMTSGDLAKVLESCPADEQSQTSSQLCLDSAVCSNAIDGTNGCKIEIDKQLPVEQCSVELVADECLALLDQASKASNHDGTSIGQNCETAVFDLSELLAVDKPHVETTCIEPKSFIEHNLDSFIQASSKCNISLQMPSDESNVHCKSPVNCLQLLQSVHQDSVIANCTLVSENFSMCCDDVARDRSSSSSTLISPTKVDGVLALLSDSKKVDFEANSSRISNSAAENCRNALHEEMPETGFDTADHVDRYLFSTDDNNQQHGVTPGQDFVNDLYDDILATSMQTLCAPFDANVEAEPDLCAPTCLAELYSAICSTGENHDIIAGLPSLVSLQSVSYETLDENIVDSYQSSFSMTEGCPGVTCEPFGSKVDILCASSISVAENDFTKDAFYSNQPNVASGALPSPFPVISTTPLSSVSVPFAVMQAPSPAVSKNDCDRLPTSLNAVSVLEDEIQLSVSEKLLSSVDSEMEIDFELHDLSQKMLMLNMSLTPTSPKISAQTEVTFQSSEPDFVHNMNADVVGEAGDVLSQLELLDALASKLVASNNGITGDFCKQSEENVDVESKILHDNYLSDDCSLAETSPSERGEVFSISHCATWSSCDRSKIQATAAQPPIASHELRLAIPVDVNGSILTSFSAHTLNEQYDLASDRPRTNVVETLSSEPETVIEPFSNESVIQSDPESNDVSDSLSDSSSGSSSGATVDIDINEYGNVPRYNLSARQLDEEPTSEYLDYSSTLPYSPACESSGDNVLEASDSELIASACDVYDDETAHSHHQWKVESLRGCKLRLKRRSQTYSSSSQCDQDEHKPEWFVKDCSSSGLKLVVARLVAS